MKDILNVMYYDFLTAKPLAALMFIAVSVMCIMLGLFVSPMCIMYNTFGIMAFVLPLQGAAEKYGFNKLYGILPVKRKNITRARFIYIYLLHFAGGIAEGLLVILSSSLKLYRVLDIKDPSAAELIKSSFENMSSVYPVFLGFFIFFTVLWTYMEMMGQIFGRDNEMKVIFITLAAVCVLIFGFINLSNSGVIPMLTFPELPQTMGDMILVFAAVSAVLFGISALFGEITAAVVSKREL